jgi:zinc transport system substrate-binding protein
LPGGPAIDDHDDHDHDDHEHNYDSPAHYYKHHNDHTGYYHNHRYHYHNRAAEYDYFNYGAAVYDDDRARGYDHNDDSSDDDHEAS